ncbi:MAG: C-type lectin domain-containing protein, partial [Alphaproteobacteria bacterium]
MRFCAVLAAGLFLATTAWSKPLLEKPIYNEATGSYYELIDYRPTGGGYGLRWEEAEKLAQKRVLGGVRGRLALIRDPQTELFLKVNLRPTSATWFGLYFDCATQSFRWIDDKPLKPGDYANFDPSNWLRDRVQLCNPMYKQTRYPAFIDMSRDKRWGVEGPLKLFYYYIVEYPTGGRVEGAEEAQAFSVPEIDEHTLPASE